TRRRLGREDGDVDVELQGPQPARLSGLELAVEVEHRSGDDVDGVGEVERQAATRRAEDILARLDVGHGDDLLQAGDVDVDVRGDQRADEAHLLIFTFAALPQRRSARAIVTARGDVAAERQVLLELRVEGIVLRRAHAHRVAAGRADAEDADGD